MQTNLLTELKESEARFRAAFQSSAIGMGLLSLDGKILQVNEAVVKMSGYTAEELCQRYDHENVYPEDRNVGANQFQELLESKRDWYQVEKRYVRKNGEVFWTRLTLSAVRDPRDKPLYVVGLIDDIHAQKKALESLQESEARFRATFDSSAIGMALTTLDGQLLRANSAICKMSGYTEDELKQRNDFENTYPEDQSAGMELFGELLAGRRDSYQVQKRYVRKNGEVFWAQVTLSAVHNAEGKTEYLVAMVEDVEGQRKNLISLVESEERFRAMFENSAIGMGIIGLDRKVMDANPAMCKMVGYTREELIGQTPVMVTYPEDFGESTRQYHDLLTGKIDHYVSERWYARKNGEIFWAQVSMSMIRHADGSPNYLVGLIADIDAQKQAQARLAEQEAEYLQTLQQRVEERTHELAQANRRLREEMEQRKIIENELAKKAAAEAVTAERTRLARELHDAVTQTLFSASLTAEVLPDLWEMDVDEAKKSTEELRQLTRGALAEMRTLLLELRPAALTQTRLSDLIKQLCEAFIGRSRLPILLNIEGECDLPPEVQVAFYRIAQESLNNVFKYARASQVDVNLFLSPAIVHFEVCDNGVGFDMSTSKPTSLGLRIMRERAEAIGAEIHITSNPGSGTCVEVIWNKDPNLKLKA